MKVGKIALIPLLLLVSCSILDKDDNSPPELLITNPSEGDKLYSNTIFSVIVNDENEIDKVEFLLDDNLIAVDYKKPYEVQIDISGKLDNNIHVLTVIASDEFGNKSEESINIIISEIYISNKVIVLYESPDIEILSVGSNNIEVSFVQNQPEINLNDYIIGTLEHPFLRRIKNINIIGNVMQIDTEDAAITDVIYKGGVDTTISFSDLRNFRNKQSQDGLNNVFLYDGVTIKSNGLELNDVVFAEGIINDATYKISIPNGFVGFQNEFDIGFNICNGQLIEFHSTAKGSIVVNLDFRGDFSDIVSLNNDDDPITLASISHTFIQMVGWIPVIEVVTLSFEAGYSLNVGFSGFIETGFDSKTGLEVGVRYENLAWNPVFIPIYDFNYHPVDWDIEAHANLRGYIRPVFSIELYGLAGPYINAEPYLQYNQESHLNPPSWEYSFIAGLESNAGIQISVFDNELVNFPLQLLNPPYTITLIADSSGQ